MRKEVPREAKTAVRMGPKRKRLVSDNSQSISLIGVYANHNVNSTVICLTQLRRYIAVGPRLLEGWCLGRLRQFSGLHPTGKLQPRRDHLTASGRLQVAIAGQACLIA